MRVKIKPLVLVLALCLAQVSIPTFGSQIVGAAPDSSPTASALDISGQPKTMKPNVTYSVTAKYFDPDGRGNLKWCYLRLKHPSKPLTMMWWESNKTYAPWAGEEGANYLTLTGVSYSSITNGYQLTWSFRIKDTWPGASNCIDFGVYVVDDAGHEVDWSYDDTNASFILVPTIVDVGISPEEYSVPTTPPTEVAPGEKFRQWYKINNPNSFNIKVILGCSIRDPKGKVISDPPRDKTVTLTPGTYWYNRFFLVPGDAEPRYYDVAYGIWAPDWSEQYEQVWKSDYLKVEEEEIIDASIILFEVGDGTKHLGDRVSISYALSNDGNVTHGFRVNCSIRDANGHYWYAFEDNLDMKAGTCTVPIRRIWTVPQGIAEGPCKGRLLVLEPDGSKTYDCKWADGPTIEAPQIKLDVLDPHTDKSSYKPSETIKLYFDVKNTGNVGVDFRSAIVYKAPDGTEIGSGVSDVVTLNPGDTRSFTFSKPASYLFDSYGKGAYYWRVLLIDPDSGTTRYTDTGYVKSFTIEAPKPDLTVTSVSASPSEVYIGKELTVSWTEKNQGNANASSFWTNVYLGKSEYGTEYNIGGWGAHDLGAGRNESFTLEPIIHTGIPPGEYYVTVFVDHNNKVDESNEQNNVGSTTPRKIVVKTPPTTKMGTYLALQINPSATINEGDEVEFWARLFDSSGNVVLGKTLKFYVAGKYVGEGSDPVTGWVSIPYNTSDLSPGSYEVKVVFEGDANYDPSYKTETLTVQGVPPREAGRTISNVSLNDDGTSMTVQLGSSVKIDFDYQIWNPDSVPGAIRQLVIQLGDEFHCVYNGIPGTYPGTGGHVSESIPVPSGAGTRDVIIWDEFEYSADDAIAQARSGNGWYQIIGEVKVSGHDNASVLSFSLLANTFKPGDSTTTTVRIRNTGTTTRSFWVGLSFQMPDGDWYDVPPKQTSILPPNGEQTLTFNRTIPSDAPAGSYDARVAVWNGYDSGKNVMVEPKYDEKLISDAFTVVSLKPLISKIEINRFPAIVNRTSLSYSLGLAREHGVYIWWDDFYLEGVYAYVTIENPAETEFSGKLSWSLIDPEGNVIASETIPSGLQPHETRVERLWIRKTQAPSPGLYRIEVSLAEKTGGTSFEPISIDQAIVVLVGNEPAVDYPMKDMDGDGIEEPVPGKEFYFFKPFPELSTQQEAIAIVDIIISFLGLGVGQARTPVIATALLSFSPALQTAYVMLKEGDLQDGIKSIEISWWNLVHYPDPQGISFVGGNYDRAVITIRLPGSVEIVDDGGADYLLENGDNQFLVWYNVGVDKRISPCGRDDSPLWPILEPNGKYKVRIKQLPWSLDDVIQVEATVALEYGPFEEIPSEDNPPIYNYTKWQEEPEEVYWGIVGIDSDKVSINLPPSELGNAITEKKVGAIVGISVVPTEGAEAEIVAEQEVYGLGIHVETEAAVKRVNVRVSSDLSEGKTIVINLDNNILPISDPAEVAVLYDGEEIDMADDYSDVLNPNDEDVPEYLVLLGARGIQILVSIPHFSTHEIVVAKSPTFEVSNLVIVPTKVTAGEPFSISVNIANTGGLEGTYPLILKINGAVENVKQITLEGGENKTVTFTITKDVEGTYDIAIVGLAGTLTVTPKPTDLRLMVGIIAVLVIIGAAVLLIKRKPAFRQVRGKLKKGEKLKKEPHPWQY